MISIADFIPYGAENAVTRQHLVRVSGLSDMDVRERIGIARRTTPIINLQNGGGYFRPREDEQRYVRKWLAQEEKRAKCLFWSMKAARDFISSAGDKKGGDPA